MHMIKYSYTLTPCRRYSWRKILGNEWQKGGKNNVNEKFVRPCSFVTYAVSSTPRRSAKDKQLKILNRDHLALSIMVPFIRLIQIFLFAKTILCILVSIELTKNVSGNQNFSHAIPPRIIVLLIPKASRGSCQNCPRYKSTSKSWKGKENPFIIQ